MGKIRRGDIYWRIALAEADLIKGNFFSWGIPIPDQPQFMDHTTRASRMDGSQSLRGYSTITFVWGTITPGQLKSIRDLVEDARDGTGYLYLTIDRNNGTGTKGDWIDVRGKPFIPESGVVEGAEGKALSNVTLRINSLEILHDPAENL